jgi:acetyl esterase/lipase
MRKRWGVAIVVLLVIAGLVFGADSQVPDEVRKKTEDFIEAKDADGDGRLSLSEFSEDKRRLFEIIDADGDGFVTADEDMAYRAGRSSGRDRAARGGQRRTEENGQTRIERDIVYARVNGRELSLDLYLPEKKSSKDELLPVIVWIHGGGWKGGGKGSGGRAKGMVERQYVLVDVEYRLSGEAIFPAQVQDCKAAIRWIRANADKYGLDPDRIGAMGSSAGGHLVTFLGTSADTNEFDTDSNAGYSSGVQAVCDLWGPTDILQMDAHNPEGARWIHDSPESPESRLVGGPIQEEPFRSLAVKVNPIKYIAKGCDIPPFLIIHGDSDMSVPPHQSKLLYEALKKAGVDVTLRLVKDGGHGLKGGDMSDDELVNLAAEFFDKHLKPARLRSKTKPHAGKQAE